jgi:N-acetylmuramate 1-kinase
VVPPDLIPLYALAERAGCSIVSIVPMPGGASTRCYLRATFDDRTSAVGMFVPAGDKPEEIEKGGARRRWPFLEVQALLAARGVRVPRVLGEETERGWLLLEDLGDDTLAVALARSPDQKSQLYTRAVRDLARARLALAELPQNSVVASRAFDDDLLRWELDHFREWALDAQGHSLSAADRASFDDLADRLARRIASFPRGFTHRDYQSRNLMVVGDELVWIDFQDALLGPRVYDLVALLNDSYQEFDRPFVAARLDEYGRETALDASDRDALQHEFDLVTVQRKLKDAGRFVFIDRVKKNPDFLRFVLPTLKKVGAALARLEPNDPDMHQLRTLLRRALPDALA